MRCNCPQCQPVTGDCPACQELAAVTAELGRSINLTVAEARIQEQAQQVRILTAERDSLLKCNRLLEAAQKVNEATIAELRAELDHIRAECVENGITPPNMTETQAFHGELSMLAVLAADKERLDWLERNRKPIIPCFGFAPPMGSGLPFPFDGFVLDAAADPLPLREAIDAARKEQP